MAHSTQPAAVIPRRKPPAAGKGRKKGTPNKITGQLKDMILGALDKAGGIDYLHDQAEKNPGAFMTLVGKVLPLQVGQAPGLGPVQFQTIERVIVDKASD